MANKNFLILNKLLRGYLIFGSIYMLLEALIHFSNIRLSDSLVFWSIDALAYSTLMTRLYASFALFLCVLLFFIQKDLRKYEQIIKILALFALFHAFILIYESVTINFDQVFLNLPSLRFWVWPYNVYLVAEALVLLSYSFIVFIWSIQKK